MEALQLAAIWHLAYLFLLPMLQLGLIPFHKDPFKMVPVRTVPIFNLYFFRNVIIAGKEYALLFFTQVPCDIIESVSTIHAGATFKGFPKCFYQLFTIHCVVSDVLMPVFYILMTAKCRTLYDPVFIQIRNNYPGFKTKNMRC